MSRHIGTLSGGVTSFYACHLMKQEQSDAELLHTSTSFEDESTERFLLECVLHLGLNYTKLTHPDGDVWGVFDRVKLLGNNRAPVCSRVLKIEQTQSYVQEGDTLYWGLEYSPKDIPRAEPIERNWLERGVKSRFPLIENKLSKQAAFDFCASVGIALPELYAKGFEHSNCGGRCVRAGLGHWAHLYRTYPERYQDSEEREASWQQRHGKSNTILKKSGKPISLKEFREQYLEGVLYGTYDLRDERGDGSCACMSAYAVDLAEVAS